MNDRMREEAIIRVMKIGDSHKKFGTLQSIKHVGSNSKVYTFYDDRGEVLKKLLSGKDSVPPKNTLELTQAKEVDYFRLHLNGIKEMCEMMIEHIDYETDFAGKNELPVVENISLTLMEMIEDFNIGDREYGT